MIGFSVLTNQYKYALEIAGNIKKYSEHTHHIRRHPRDNGPSGNPVAGMC